MGIYQRPLRPDELMHWGIGSRGQERPNHKYKERKWVNGAWQYIYDLTGGKYKKQAADHKQKSREDRNASKNYEKWAKQDYNNSKINYDSARAYDKAANKELLKGIASGEKYSDQPHTKRSVELTNKSNHHNVTGKIAYDSSRLMYRKSLDHIESARKHDNAAKTANEKYRNSLAGKYDRFRTDANATKKKLKKWGSKTVNTAQKHVNNGKKIFQNFYNSIRPRTYVTFSDGTKHYLN